ncbi:MAG: four helix bundle protein [Nitrospirales bacterium]
MDKPHKKLDLWQCAIEVTMMVYQYTESFPEKETYGLSSQMRRAAVSVSSNIAEGAARQTRKEFIQYLYIAQGSLSELDTQLEIVKRLRYVNDPAWSNLDENIERVDRMISGLIRFQRSPHAPHLTSHVSRLTSSNPGGTHGS